MKSTLTKIKEMWENKLSTTYGGKLEVDYFPKSQDDELHGYYACAFHDEPKNGCDSWVERIKEFDCLGTDKSIPLECHGLGIPVCG